MHARACAKIVEAAARFQSEITIIKDGQRVNARSIMGLMMLAASLGSEIGVEAEGPDAGCGHDGHAGVDRGEVWRGVIRKPQTFAASNHAKRAANSDFGRAAGKISVCV